MSTSSNVIKLPSSLRARLSDSQLGVVQSIHKEVLYPFSLLIFLIGSLVCLYLAIFWDSPWGGLYSYITFAILLFGSWVMWLERYNQIVIFSDGLLYVHGEVHGKQLDVARWDEIEQVQVEYADWVQSSDIKYYTIVRRDGTWFSIKVGPIIWKRDKTFRAAIEREVTQRLLPAAITQFEQDGAVSFGELSVEREDIRGWFKDGCGQERIKEIPWSEIEGIQTRKQDISLLKTDQRRERIPYSYSATTPNLFVFTALVKHILSSRQA